MPALVRSRMISRSLGQRTEDVEHKLAGPGRGIYALGQRPKSYAAIDEGVHGLSQVSHRAPEPVQPPHDQDAISADVVEQSVKLWLPVQGTGGKAVSLNTREHRKWCH
jgi:hypothetical protein